MEDSTNKDLLEGAQHYHTLFYKGMLALEDMTRAFLGIARIASEADLKTRRHKLIGMAMQEDEDGMAYFSALNTFEHIVADKEGDGKAQVNGLENAIAAESERLANTLGHLKECAEKRRFGIRYHNAMDSYVCENPWMHRVINPELREFGWKARKLSERFAANEATVDELLGWNHGLMTPIRDFYGPLIDNLEQSSKTCYRQECERSGRLLMGFEYIKHLTRKNLPKA